MGITWEQINTDGDGYINYTEANAAKKKGVINVWPEMTEADYKENVSLTQKIDLLVCRYTKLGKVKHCIVLTEPGVDRSDEQIYLARLDRQLTNLKQEYENLNKEFQNKYSFLDKLKHCICKGNDQYCNDIGELNLLKTKISEKENELISAVNEYRSGDLG